MLACNIYKEKDFEKSFFTQKVPFEKFFLCKNPSFPSNFCARLNRKAGWCR